MTGFSVDPKWFPTTAIPLLLCTILAAFLGEKLVADWGLYKQSKASKTRLVQYPIIPATAQDASHLTTSLHSMAAAPAQAQEKSTVQAEPSAETTLDTTRGRPNLTFRAHEAAVTDDRIKAPDPERLQRQTDTDHRTPSESSRAIYLRHSYAVSGEVRADMEPQRYNVNGERFRGRMRAIAEQSTLNGWGSPRRVLSHRRISSPTRP